LANIVNQIWLQDFRCFENLELFFSEGLNWIHGDNGSGKTSILEAVYWCSRARSFRTSQTKTLIRKDQPQALVRLSFNEQILGSAISRKEAPIFRYQSEPIKRTSELSRILSTQFLGPQSHKLVEPDPDARRYWLDWSLFHVKQRYLVDYQTVKRALQQRNIALKQRQARNLIYAFNPIIVESALLVESARTDFVQALTEHLDLIAAEFKLPFRLGLQYRSALPADKDSYQLLLNQHLAADLDRGFTWHSPFRSKLLVTADGQLATQTLSRGQQKLAAFIMLLAQQRLLNQQGETPTILLVDDLHAELDQSNRLLLANYLNSSGQQVLVTSTELPDSNMQSQALFHVKQGKLLRDNKG